MDLEDLEKYKIQSSLSNISLKWNELSKDTNQGTVIEQIDGQCLVNVSPTFHVI